MKTRIERTRFVDNLCTGNNGPNPFGGTGGGIRSSGDLELIDCHLEGNRALPQAGASSYGGGVSFTHQHWDHRLSRIEGCVFKGNRATFGAGMDVNSADSLLVSGCLFDSNRAGWVGAGEYARFGGGMSIYSGNGATVINSIFANNEITHDSSGIEEGAAIHTYPHSGHIVNNLIVGNRGAAAFELEGVVAHGYNAFWNNPDGDLGGPFGFPAEGEIFIDPKLCGDRSGWRPAPGSPLIDGGTEFFADSLLIEDYCGEVPEIGWHEICRFPPACVEERPIPVLPDTGSQRVD